MKKGFEKRAARYAKALLELVPPNDFRSCLEELMALATVFTDAANRSFIEVLSNPVLPLAQKKEIVISSLNNSISAPVKNVVLMLLERGAADLLPKVALHFEKLVNEFEKLSELQITSAKPLSDSEQNAFKESVKGKLGSIAGLVQFNFDSDPGLLGGMQIRVGDKLLDSSIKGAMERIFENLGRSEI